MKILKRTHSVTLFSTVSNVSTKKGSNELKPFIKALVGIHMTTTVSFLHKVVRVIGKLG